MNNDNSDDLKKLLDHQPLNQIDKEINQLQEENTRLKKDKNDERFIWILVVIILFDSFCFSHAQTWGAPIVTGIIELILIMIIAQSLGIAPLITYFDHLLEILKSKNGK